MEMKCQIDVDLHRARGEQQCSHLKIEGAVTWYSYQLERLDNMPVMNSNLEWTVSS